MTTIERPLDTPTTDDPGIDDPTVDDRSVDDPAVDDDTTTIDLVAPDARAEPVLPPRLRPATRGMRIRRVRLRSVAKIASVFFVLGYVTLVGSLVVLWNVALGLGYVDTVEETVTTSLGLDEPFTVVGADLFELVAIGSALAMAFGLVLTVLLALVYNVACAVFGGLAVETGPLLREHRLYSLRERRFVTVRW